MKTLYVIRHAKSSWDDGGLSDFERPLNDRGKRDALKMAKRLIEKHVHPDLMLSSSAKRAYATAKRIAKVLGFKKDNIKTDERLYHADEETILSVIHEIKSTCSTAFIFGHNPGLTDFVNTLRNDELDIENIPTCGIVAFSIPVDTWKDVTWGSGKILFYDYPKK
ncbi:MAG TPA: histidine phosphatase family protein [Ohtaekwangia sp.]|nr:histidine phosphatase family protein [Ohtaekwangia sp.]